MNRQEKLHLSADTAYCYCFKHGVFARLYEQSLFWFSYAEKPLKPMLERVKGGEPVMYGGLSISSLEALLEQGRLYGAEITQATAGAGCMPSKRRCRKVRRNLPYGERRR